MEYIGNYSDIVKQDWIDFLMNNEGQLLPDNRECLLPEFDQQNVEIFKKWNHMPTWYKFEIQDLPFTIPWPVPLTNNIDWWIIKQHPGQLVPIHIDQNPPDITERYILMLQDYIPGHITTWAGEFIHNYKRGDLYKVKDVNALHGGSNISNEVRLLAYLTVWN